MIRRFFALLIFLLPLLYHPPRAAAEEPFRILLVADTHLGFKKSNEAFQKFLADAPTLPFKAKYLINIGDIAEIGTREIFEKYNREIESLGLSPLNVIGNHDTRWASQGKDLFTHFVGPRYFSKDFEGIHWLFLDSTLEHQTQGHVERSEIEWMKKDLAAAPPGEPVFVFSHHPLKWRGTSIDNGLEVLNILDHYPVAALFNGHGHKLEKIKFRGIPFIEDDALFNGNYLVLEKSGDQVKLYIKTLGEPELKPWLDIDLHPKPSRLRILEPLLDAFADKNIKVKLKCENQGHTPISNEPAKSRCFVGSLQIDRSAPLPLQSPDETAELNVATDRIGWHDLRLITSESPWGEDETKVFVPDSILMAEIGEVYAGLATDGHQVFAGTLDGTLYAVSPDAKVRWSKKLDDGILAAPFAGAKSLYVGTRGGTLYSLAPADGTVLWKVKKEAPFTSSPYLFGETVFIGNADKNLYAIDAKTGKERWHSSIGDFTEMQPLADNGKIFLGAWDHTFYSFDIRDGHILWKKNIGKAEYYSPSVARPLAFQGTVYVAAKDHQVYALDENTGKEKWSEKTNDTFSSPLLVENALILPETSGGVVALDPATGKKLWTKELEASFYTASPLVKGHRLYLVGVEGNYVVLNLKDQKIEEEFRVSKGWNFSTPVFAGDRIVIGSLDGHLYSLPLKN